MFKNKISKILTFSMILVIILTQILTPTYAFASDKANSKAKEVTQNNLNNNENSYEYSEINSEAETSNGITTLPKIALETDKNISSDSSLPDTIGENKIERFSLQWITKDNDSDENCLNNVYKDNKTKSISFGIIYALSGKGNYDIGKLNIVLPKTIFKNRNGEKIGDIKFGIPKLPDRNDNFAYQETEDSYIITNTKKISAAASGGIECTIYNLTPSEIKDIATSYISEPIFANLEIETTKGTIGKKSNILKSTIDTDTRIYEAHLTHDNYETVKSKFPNSWDLSLKPENPDNYYYVEYNTYANSKANQYFDVDLDINVRNSEDSKNAIILGYRNNKNGEVTKGDGSGNLSVNIEKNNYLDDGSNFAGEIYVAYPIQDFAYNREYNLGSSVQFTMRGVDDGKITKAKTEDLVLFKPAYIDHPEGQFYVEKQGTGDEITTSFNKYDLEGIYDIALNELRDGKSVDTSFDIETRAWAPLHTLKKDGDFRKISDYGQSTYKLITEDFKTTFNYKDRELTSDDFSIKALDLAKKPLAENVSSFSDGNTFTNKLTGIEFTTSKKIRKIFNFSLVDDRDIPITNIFGKINNSDTWIKLGSVDYTNGIAIINPENGSTVDGTKLVFPENITDFKTEVDTKIVHYVHDIKAIFTIKPSENILKEVNSKYGNNKLSMTRFTNKIKLRVESEEQGSGFVNEYTANNILTDFSYGIKPEKKLINYSNDQKHKRIDLEYEIASKIQTNITSKKALKTVKEKSYIKDQKEGVFYELLPKGVNPITDSIKPVRKGDSITSVKAYENYQNSGRIMLEIHLKETPDYKYEYRNEKSILGMKGYYDRPAVRFKAQYTWMNHRIYSPILSCIMAYKSTEKVGNTEGLESETNVFSNKNKFTKEAFETEEEKNIFNSLGEGNYVYARDYSDVDVPTSYVTTLLKQVDVNDEGLYNDGLDNILSKNVYENGKYSYSISIRNSDIQASKDIVFYDNLEKYKPQKDSDDYGDIQWRGIFDSVNTDSLKKLGVEAVIYYSTKDNLVLDDENNRKDNDLTNTDIWSKTMPKDKSSIKAIAIDARKTVKNDDFILDKNQSIDLIINMRAPNVSDKRYYDKVLEKDQKEVGFVGGAHAYNNAVMTCRHISLDNGNITDNLLIRNDYTKVGLKPYNISVKKTFDDENNRDGVREDKAIIELVGNGTPTGKILTLSEKNNWEGTFSELPYLDKEGNVISYTFREINNQKYTLKVNRDNNSTDNKYNLVNFHSPEKIKIQGEKHWVDKTEEKRPQSILITLKADGKEIDNREVKPDSEGKWKYEFDNLYKYRDGGKKINYTVEEKNYITGYVSEVKDFDIVNTYHPYANVIVKKEVIDQTEKAKELNPDFTFKFNLTDSEGNLIFKEYEYTTNLGRKGKIFSGNEFKLKKDEQMTIKNVDSETSVEVKEIKKPSGYKNVESPPEKLIQAGKDVELKFINKYVTFGRTTLESTKKLVGRKLLNKEFRFDLLLDDKEIDSTYNDKNGKVIFNNLEYSNKDVGKTYTYKIKEYNNNHAGITYTNEISQVDVKVSDDGKGSISVEKNYADKNFVFTNKYNATGKVNLKAWKQIKGDYNKLGKYDFELYDDKNNVVATGTNDENGTINFTDLVYSEKDAGKTFIYTAKERQGKDDSIIYDKSTITYKVEVIDNLDGTLSFNTSVVDNKTDDKNNDSTTPLFVNEYKNGKLTVRKNVLNGDTNKEFRFKIKFKGENIPNGKFDLNKKNNISSLNKVKKFFTDIFKPKEAHAAEIYAPEGEVIHSGYLSGDVKYEIYENGHMVISSIGNSGTLPEFPDYDNEFGYRKYKDKIKSISFSGDVKANVKSDNLFCNLDKVVSIDTTNLDTKRTTSMGSMFSGCQSLKELDVSKFDTSKVTNMWAMFVDCELLEKLDLSNFDTSEVTYMHAMFSGCKLLEKLDVSNFDTSKVMNMSYMFDGCKLLKELDLRKFDTSKVIYMSNMFSGCESLKELDLSKFDTSKVTEAMDILEGDESLITLSLPNFKPETSGGILNSLSKSLKKLDVSKVNFSSLGDIDLQNLDSLEEVVVPSKLMLREKKYFPVKLNGTFITDDGEVFAPDKDIFSFGKTTLTKKGLYYTIKFVTDTGEKFTPIRLKKDEEKKLPSPKIKKPGYKFLGWSTTQDKKNIVTDIKTLTQADKNDITLYAVWKELETNINIKNGEAEFMLSADEQITLDNLPAGISYEIYEEQEEGWVLVKEENTNGTIEPNKETIATFTNDYRPQSTQAKVQAKKLLNSAPAKGFEFELLKEGQVIDKATSLADGSITFNTLTFDTAGTFNYQIREVKGNDPNINYDSAIKNVKIEVTDNGRGKKEAKVTYTDTPTFNNTTKLGKLEIKKEVTGTTDNSKDFTFEILINGKKQNITLKNGESKTIDSIPYGSSYEVKEINLPKGYVTAEIENASGVISSSEITVLAKNKYNPIGNVQIKAKKVLENKDLSNGEFDFELLDSNDNVLDTAKNDRDGNIYFNSLEIKEAKNAKYKIREVQGNEKDIVYDNHEEIVNVTVTDDGEGNLTARAQYDDDGAIFTNKYNVEKIPKIENETNFTITKKLEGTSTDKEFEVKVDIKKDDKKIENVFSYTSNLDSKEHEFVSGEKVKIKGNEILTFKKVPLGAKVTLTEDSYPGYTVKEDSILEKVLEDKENNLKITNVYHANGKLELKAKKELLGGNIKDYNFDFLLMNDGYVLSEVKNDENGNIDFDSIRFNENDIGKTYEYLVIENTGYNSNINYDQTEYKFTVKIEDNGDGTLNLIKDGDYKNITFKNSIKPRLPTTGTRKGIGILIGLFSLLLMTFIRKKFNLIKLIKREKNVKEKFLISNLKCKKNKRRIQMKNIYKNIGKITLSLALLFAVNPVTYLGNASKGTNVTLHKLAYQDSVTEVNNTGGEIDLNSFGQKVRNWNKNKDGVVKFTAYKLDKKQLNTDKKAQNIANEVSDAIKNNVDLPYGAEAKGEVEVDDNGNVNFSSLDDGTYVFVETTSSDIVKQTAKPMLISLPMSDAEGKTNLENIHLYAKNKINPIEINFTKYVKKFGEQVSILQNNKSGFSLYKGEPGQGTLIQDSYQDLTSGSITVTDLLIGKYYFVEESKIDPQKPNYGPDNIIYDKDVTNNTNNKLTFEYTNEGKIVFPADSLLSEGKKVVNYTKPNVEKTVDKEDVAFDEDINFTINTQIPDNIDKYENYLVKDTPDESLKINEDSVKVGYDEKGEFKNVAFTKDFQNNILTVTPDLTAIKSLAGKTLKITYTAKLDKDKAQTGQAINNKAEFDFNNGVVVEKNTSEKSVKTYEASLEKTDGGVFNTGLIKQGLKDAKFVLAKANSNDKGAITKYLKIDKTTKEYTWVDNKDDATELSTGENGILNVKGLANGHYFFIETQAPTGYNMNSNPYNHFEIKDASAIDKNKVKVSNDKKPDMPMTGTEVTLIVIAVLAGVLVITVVVKTCQNRRKQ